ncbi:MAG: hypothetical protein JWO57_1662 [Pseudonocardiales bacterium]|nr:hypothetical protein [Pseudonocardiales bacterium]
MSVLCRIAGPLVASTFASSGFEALGDRSAQNAESNQLARRVVAATPGLSTVGQLRRLIALTRVLGATALAYGRVPRMAALVILASLVPTSPPPPGASRPTQLRSRLAPNASLVGALLLAVDGGAVPGHRSHRRIGHGLVGGTVRFVGRAVRRQLAGRRRS